MRANGLFKSNQFDKSIYYFNKMKELRGLDPDLVRIICMNYLELENSSEADKILNHGLITFPKDENLIFLKAHLLVGEKKFKESIELTEKLLELNENDEEYLIFYSNLLGRIGKSNEAIKILKKIISDSLLKENSTNLESVIDENFSETENYIALNNLGFERTRIGDFENAVRNLELAIKINPNFAYAYNNLGYAYLKQNKYDEAIKMINYSLELDNQNSYAYKNKALYFIELKNEKEALNNLYIAKKLNYEDLYDNDVEEMIFKIKSKNED